jgi:hypothetical protein
MSSRFKKNPFDNVRDIGGRSTRSIIVSMDQAKQRVLRSVVDKERWLTQPYQDERLRAIAEMPYNSIDRFYSEYQDETTGRKKCATGDELVDWIRHGYHSKLFRNIAERVPVGLQHRPAWNEEDGDIEVSRLYGGYDDFYLGMAERVSKPGIRVQFGLSFSCGVSNQVIAQYGAWIFGMLAGMESEGFDVTVDAAMSVRDLFQGERNVTSHVLLRVKKAGEISNPADWSVLFSPIGFRVLGFTAFNVAGDKIGKVCQHNLGYPATGHKWDLNYTPEDSLVQIFCNSSAYSHDVFPADVLTEKAIAAGLLPSGE